MKLTLYKTLVLCAMFLHPALSFASHVFGGDLLYTHLGGNTYRLSLTLYGDCGSPTGAFPTLHNAHPKIHIYHGFELDSFSVNLAPTSDSGIEVSPVCPSQVNNTACKNGTLPGVMKFIYVGDIAINSPQADWNFVFYGDMGPDSTVSGAGRSQAITNISDAGNTFTYLQAMLNNTAGPNSSPQYTSIPTPYYAVNLPQQYNQGAVDLDGDSLAYSLVQAIDRGIPATYVYPLTPDLPLRTDPGEFIFSPLNGQMSFTPSSLQDALVVNQVSEYKNGVLVGTSTRELTFIVLDNLGSLNNIGGTDAVNIIGAANIGVNVISTCVNTPSVSFDIVPADTAGNKISASYTTIPSGATLTVQNNNTAHPSLHFNWNTSTVPVGIYNFFVTYKNDACPISTSQTIAYTINVVNPFKFISATQEGPTECVHGASVRVEFADGILPVTISVYNGNTLVTASQSDTNPAYIYMPAGNFSGIIGLPGLTCSAPFTFSVVDSGRYPYTPVVPPTKYCVHEQATPLIADTAKDATVQWFDANHVALAGPPTPITDSEGLFTCYVTQLVDVCPSDTLRVRVPIYPAPSTNLHMQRGAVCVGAVVYLDDAGADRHYWEPQSQVKTDDEGREYIRVFSDVTYTFHAVSANGCQDSVNVSYDDVQPCCNFAYPDAFTPNDDGKNDRYRAIIFGNLESYEISIYDRYGLRVYWTNDPYSGWDGRYHGRLCDPDVFFYHVHAKCYSGHVEDMKGSLHLIR